MDQDRPLVILLRWFFKALAFQTLKRGLRGVWVRGNLPVGPCVLAPNHHSWWDTYVWPVLLWREERRMAAPMLDYRVKEFFFMPYLGIQPASKPRQTLKALRQGATVLIFPEGQLQPPAKLGELQRGSAWLSQQSGYPLVPAVLRVVLRAEEMPEAYVWFGSPVEPDTQQLSQRLSQMLGQLDQEFHSHHPEQPLPNFSLLIKGRSSTQERTAAWLPLLKPFTDFARRS